MKISNLDIDIYKTNYAEGWFSGEGIRVKVLSKGDETDFEFMFTEASKWNSFYKNNRKINTLTVGVVCSIRLCEKESSLASSFCDSHDLFDPLIGNQISFCKAWKMFYSKLLDSNLSNRQVSELFKAVYAYISHSSCCNLVSVYYAT
jgi:hypothetical protein